MTSTFDGEAQAYHWVHEHMPREEAAALAQFVAIHPNQRGIHWWDALSMLRDYDAHLDVTEPMAEAMDGDEWTVLHTFVTYTILYAERAFSDYTTEHRVQALRATINNGGGGA